jgi:tRNA(Ile)-lysidine synthase
MKMKDMDLLDAVRGAILAHNMVEDGDTLVLGVSGGPDSLCLAHALLTLRGELGLTLHLAHLDHGIRGEESQADAAFVVELARQWGLPATVESGDVPHYARAQGLATEEAARRKRYLFLGGVAQETGARCVAVGHNADDQVETILMHLMRGSGLGGLRGMLFVQLLGAEPWWSGPTLRLIRPLLDVPRREIEAYCQEQNLKPRFDRSNLDLTYHRNRIRHELIPHLESFNPRIREVLRRSAQVIADDYDYLRLQGLDTWSKLAGESEETVTFPLQPWSQLHPSLQRQLLREAIHRLRSSLRDITWTHVEQARRGLDRIESGGRITLPQGLSLFKGYDCFSISEVPTRPDVPLLLRDPVPLAVPGVTRLPESGWAVRAEIVAREGAAQQALENTDPWQSYLDLEITGPDLCLRVRRPRDCFQPLGMGGKSKSLTAFMIDAKIPREIRDQLPLVVSPAQIVWVAGYRIDERARITGRTRQVLRSRFVKTD